MATLRGEARKATTSATSAAVTMRPMLIPAAMLPSASASLIQRAAARWISEADAEGSMAAGISIGRMVTAAEVADVVAFLASPRSVAINGDAIAAGGGARHAIHY